MWDKKHAEHLKSILEQNYNVSIGWSGTKYVGLTLGWDYGKREVHLEMLTNVLKALTRFQHPQPRKP